jgi:hypothetical protein
MAASVVPALIDALVAAASTALPNVLVLDGVGMTDDPGDYLMVGVLDPDIDGPFEAARSTQEQMAFGSTRPRKEEGVIHMVAKSVSGDGSQKAARDAAYAIQEALATVLRTTDNLGVAGVVRLGNGADMTPTQDQTHDGAVATLPYDIAFEAAI